MLKSLLGIAATGAAAVLVWKLLAIVLLPMIGLAIGIVALVVKVAVTGFVLLIAFWIFRRMTRSPATT